MVEYVSEKPDFVDEPGNLNLEAQQDFLRVFQKFSVAEEMFPSISKASFSIHAICSPCGNRPTLSVSEWPDCN